MDDDKKIYPALTAEEFNEGAGYTFRGVPIVEDELGCYVYAFGHVDRELCAQVVNDYDNELAGEDFGCSAKDVQHVYAVTVAPPDGPDGWWIRWSAADQDHADRFPLTVVDR